MAAAGADNNMAVLSEETYRHAVDMRVFLALHGGLRPSLYTFFSRGCNGLLQNIVFPNPLRDLLLSGLMASLMSRVATRPG